MTEIGLMLIPFSVNLLAWMIFRADSIAHGWEYLLGLFSWGTGIEFHRPTTLVLAGIAFLILHDWWHEQDERNPISKLPFTLSPALKDRISQRIVDGVVLGTLFTFILVIASRQEAQSFIYFAF